MCTVQCSGNLNDICGSADNELYSFYHLNGAFAGTRSPSSPNTETWSALGCYTDTTSARTLSNLTGTQGNVEVTIESCTLACQFAGFSLAGTEYSSQCCASDCSLPNSPTDIISLPFVLYEITQTVEMQLRMEVSLFGMKGAQCHARETALRFVEVQTALASTLTTAAL